MVDVDVTSAGALRLGDMDVPLPENTAKALAEGGAGTYGLGVRPEHLTLDTEGLAGDVTVVEELGSEAFLFVTVQHQGAPTQLVVRAEGDTPISRGDTVHIGFKGPIHLFAPSGERIGD